jgi:Flp pilus assembly protein TadG
MPSINPRDRHGADLEVNLRAGQHPGALHAKLRRLARDRSGNVAILFSLMLVPLVTMMGLAVDFGHVYSVTSHTQS